MDITNLLTKVALINGVELSGPTKAGSLGQL